MNINGSAIQPDPAFAELIVNFEQNPGGVLSKYRGNCVSTFIIAVPTVIPNYFVLDTDYSSYSIVYDCFDVLGVAKAGWMSRC